MLRYRVFNASSDKRNKHMVVTIHVPLALIRIPTDSDHGLGKLSRNRQSFNGKCALCSKLTRRYLSPYFVVFNTCLIGDEATRLRRNHLGVDAPPRTHRTLLRILNDRVLQKRSDSFHNEARSRTDFDECLRRALIVCIPIELHANPILVFLCVHQRRRRTPPL